MALSQLQKECIRYLTPPDYKDRGMTKEEFATTIREHSDYKTFTHETLKQWEYGNRDTDREFQAALKKAREAYQHDPEFMAKVARNVALIELVKGAQSQPGPKDGPGLTHKRGCLKELMKATANLEDADATISYADYSDEQLEELMLGRGLADVSLTGR